MAAAIAAKMREMKVSALKNDDFLLKTVDFLPENGGFGLKNDDFAENEGEKGRGRAATEGTTGEMYTKNDEFCIKNDEFWHYKR